MRIEFRSLSEIRVAEIADLMNHSLVRRHLPLAKGEFGPAQCEAFLARKQRLWVEYGYGPWAIRIDGHFAGWGGLQPENGEPDVALVLHPRFWGAGRRILREILRRAFGEMGFTTVTALLPRGRVHTRGMPRLGFQPIGELTRESQKFMGFRLAKPTVPAVHTIHDHADASSDAACCCEAEPRWQAIQHEKSF